MAFAALAFCLAFAAPMIVAATTPLRVGIIKFAYAQKEITVAPGTTVVWTNRDEVPHTVTSRDKLISSSALDTDDQFQYTFSQEGDFDYYCTVHPFMTGVVHVRRP